MLPQADSAWTAYDAAHLLNRAGFGGSPEDVRALHAMGREKAVESFISPTEALDAFPLPDWASDASMLASMSKRFESQRMMRRSLRGKSPEEAEKIRRESRKDYQQEVRRQGLEAQGWWFRRMLTSRAPLREKMTLFWHDHFATSIQKVKQPAFVIRQNQMFRENAFGSFRELTQAILLDPAMMLYLDTQSSKKGHPNENFAREVMELFTLGEGNYSEEDIKQAARAFTGYQLNRATGKVYHNRRQWDSSDKTVFGKTGPYDGKAVIDLIFQKREAARFMAGKLWEFFVYENPPEAALESLTDSFLKANFNTGPLLREFFLSKEFYATKAVHTQIKCPLQYLISLLKQLELKTPPVGFPILAEQQLGQIPFLPPNVAGWDWGKAWINTNTLLTRYNLAGFLTKGTGLEDSAMANQKMKTPGMAKGPKRMGRNWQGPDYETIAPRPLRENPEALVDSLIDRFFQAPVPEKARASFIDYATAKQGVVFTNQETAELCHLILSTPYYQLC
ncbi:MAG: DUF1800 domain-containing protein [Verrucomicrobiota bacterium]